MCMWQLQAIQCMDVAEQALQALEMLSKKHNKAILHAVCEHLTELIESDNVSCQ